MNLALWRDISIVWLSLFCFVGLVIPIVILYFAVSGMNKGLARVRPALHAGQRYSRMIRVESETLTQKVSEPVIQSHKYATQLRATLRSLWPLD